MMHFLIGLIWAVVVLEANASFRWSNCHTTDDVLHITNLELAPDPLVIPGDIIMTVDGASTAPIGNSALHLSIKRKFGLYFPVPCIKHIGSCTYPNICTLMDQLKHESWMSAETATQIDTMLENSGINATLCPQPAQTVHIDHQHIRFPKLIKAITHFAAGEYHIKATLIDNNSGKIHMCINAELTVAEKDPCTGFFCIFG